MNKFLLGTTALISAAAFTAPALAAEKIQLELRGYHVGGMSYADIDGESVIVRLDEFPPNIIVFSGDEANEINFGSDSEVHFRGSTTLDNGLQVSFRAELELEDDSDVDGNADQIDEVYIQFDGGFGRVQFGQNDGAMYQQHIAAPNAFVGHGVNQPDVRMDPFGPYYSGVHLINTYGSASGDNIKLTYFTPSMNGLQFGASYTPNPCENDTGYSGCVMDEFGRNHIQISGTWLGNLDNITLGLSAGYGMGEGTTATDDPTEWTVGGEIGFAGLTIGGSYRDMDLDSTWEETHWDAGVSYETGPWAFSLTYGTMETDGLVFTAGIPAASEADQESWIGGVTYMYGPGMQIGFGVQTMDSEGVYISPDLVDEHFIDGTSFFIENVISF